MSGSQLAIKAIRFNLQVPIFYKHYLKGHAPRPPYKGFICVTSVSDTFIIPKKFPPASVLYDTLLTINFTVLLEHFEV